MPMPATLTYPGVYIQELPSGTRAITGVATSITAFVGRAWRGALNEPAVIFSFADYERQFGGLWRESTLSYTVQQFFANGGSQAVIVRVATGTAQFARIELTDEGGGLFTLLAATPGTWGRNLTASIDLNTNNPPDTQLFNLTLLDDPEIRNDAFARGGSGVRETFLNVSTNRASPRYVGKILAQQSSLARVLDGSIHARPITVNAVHAVDGGDGEALASTDVLGTDAGKTGIYALRKTDIFNLLCLPPLTPGADGNDFTGWGEAARFCKDRRAFLLVDAPRDWDVGAAVDAALTSTGPFSSIVDRNHSAMYFPRLLMPDPLQENRLESFAPSGAVAGILSRIDGARGVWKAPAGTEAGVQGVVGLSVNGSGLSGNGPRVNLTDNEVGRLNPLGINSVRALPTIGHVVWGARTLEGADVFASQWKYVPVRRLALFIEESLFRGTQWVVFEPNDEPLWAQIRLNVGGFMQTLFRQGAFQGSTAKDAYFVKCSRETTTQTDIDNGVVNIIVGFAPLKPAEFVVIQIQQIASQP
jgi:phage tail sheath protein FI